MPVYLCTPRMWMLALAGVGVGHLGWSAATQVATALNGWAVALCIGLCGYLLGVWHHRASAAQRGASVAGGLMGPWTGAAAIKAAATTTTTTPSALQPSPPSLVVAARLARALELLGDLLPGHVVEELLLGPEGEGLGEGQLEGEQRHGHEEELGGEPYSCHHQLTTDSHMDSAYTDVRHSCGVVTDTPIGEDNHSSALLHMGAAREQQQQGHQQQVHQERVERRSSSWGGTGTLWQLLGPDCSLHSKPLQPLPLAHEDEQQQPLEVEEPCAWQQQGPEGAMGLQLKQERAECCMAAAGDEAAAVCLAPVASASSTASSSTATSTRSASSRASSCGGGSGEGSGASSERVRHSRSPSSGSGCDMPCRTDTLRPGAEALASAPATVAAGVGFATEGASACGREGRVEQQQAAQAAEAVRLASESAALPAPRSASAIAAAEEHRDLLASVSAPLPALRLPRRSGSTCCQSPFVGSGCGVALVQLSPLTPLQPLALSLPPWSSARVSCDQTQQQQAPPVPSTPSAIGAPAPGVLPQRPPLPRVRTMPVQRCTIEPPPPPPSQQQKQQQQQQQLHQSQQLRRYSLHRSTTSLSAALLDRAASNPRTPFHEDTRAATVSTGGISCDTSSCGDETARVDVGGEAVVKGVAARLSGSTISRSQSLMSVAGSRAAAWLRSRSASASASALAAAAAVAVAAVAAPFTAVSSVAGGLTGAAAAAAAPEATQEDGGEHVAAAAAAAPPATAGGGDLVSDGQPAQQQVQVQPLLPAATAAASNAAAIHWSHSGAVNSPRASRRLHRSSTGCFSVSTAGVYGSGVYGSGGADTSAAFGVPAAGGSTMAMGCVTATGASGGGNSLWRAQRGALTEAGEEGTAAGGGHSSCWGSPRVGAGMGAASALAVLAPRASVHLPLPPPMTGGGWCGGGGGSGRDLPYAEWHPCVSVLFADLVGFTAISNKVPPVAVMEMLNALYCRLDALCNVWGQQQQQPPGSPLHGSAAAASFLSPGAAAAATAAPPCPPGSVYKVQIIGDAYMVATGLLADDPAHAATACMFALAVLREAEQVLDPVDGQPLRLRIGIHSGPVVSGVVGRLRRQYSVFGDTVNVASRMESTGTAGVIHVSEDTQRLAAPHMPPGCGRWLRREGVEVKGKGTMDTYWLLPQGHEDAAVAEGSDGMAADGRVWTAAGPAEAE